MKKWKKVLSIILGIVGLFALLMIFTNIYIVMLKPLESGTGIENEYGDVILVLGGGLKKGREIGYSTEERLLLAVELFKQRQRPVIISGGSLYRGSPAIKKIKDFLAVRGIPNEFITFEGKSQTTFDNFQNTKDLIRQSNSKEVIVVTSPYHQERARMIMNYLQFDNFKIATMNKSEVFQADSVGQRLRNIRLIFREYLAIIKFKVFKK